ncbi:MAG: small-conductance mechanosensitive channel/CRP-like cAMP-binding protein [Parasphingorhabdus sp.]|jgi:small-conductance mechanosensitive channel/CRP-like cAMP-binding protein
MIDRILEQIITLIESFSGSDALQGVVGFLLFLTGLFVIKLFPKSIRSLRIFWFVEIFLLPSTLIAGASIFAYVLGETGILVLSEDSDYISAVALVLASAYLVDRAVGFFIWNSFSKDETGGIPAIVKTVVTAVIYVASGYVIIAVVYGNPVTGLVISSGVLLGVLGLGFQPVLGDIISGISLTIDRPFKAGDQIEIEGGIEGVVISTDWRATRIKTLHETVYVIPNGQLSNATIHNKDEPDSRYTFWFFVPVASSVSPKLVIQLLIEAAIKSPNILDDPVPVVRLASVEELPLRYIVIVKTRDYHIHFQAKGELLVNAWELFNRAGFSFAAKSIEAEFWRGQPAHGEEPKPEAMLDEVQLLAPLTSAERLDLAKNSALCEFAAEDPIVVQGDDGDSAYLILAGMVRIHRTIEDDGGRELDLTRLGTFDFFGEMSLLTGAPRSASVTAYTNCRLLKIPKPCLEPILEKRPELAEELAHLMAERKLNTEIMSSESHAKSVGDRLAEYKKAFTSTIRGFFVLDEKT